MDTTILNLRERPEWLEQAAEWFHAKWGVPLSAYRESMAACVRGGSSVPQWYLTVDGATILGGLGVIENDFHDRKDLAPNVCAVYVEEPYRCRGIAGALLEHYERYGWRFLCMAQGDGEDRPSRMYVRRWGA